MRRPGAPGIRSTYPQYPMFIYAGIDEAGYGPMFGPLLVARSVFAIPNLAPTDAPPQLWQRLSKAVCRTLSNRRGRIAVNDSKKLHTPASGLKHLELGVLAFAALSRREPEDVGAWVDCLGANCHDELAALPWYRRSEDRPWNALPGHCTAGELAVARGMLRATCTRIGVNIADLGASVVLEPRFNRMVAATRSKAAASFTFVAAHLQAIWNEHAQHEPFVVVDRQSGRSHYREVLALSFPDLEVQVIEESSTSSAYRLHRAGRAMTVTFVVEAEQAHMPVALASMVAKYTRELLMHRFQSYFAARAPDIKPTAGYALDAKRFWQEIQPRLGELEIDGALLRRMA